MKKERQVPAKDDSTKDLMAGEDDLRGKRHNSIFIYLLVMRYRRSSEYEARLRPPDLEVPPCSD